MSDTIAPHVTAAAKGVLARRDILSNPFFQGLHEAMDKARFLLTQQQFYYAVLFFSRPMAGLIARLPNPHTRLDLLHNLVEEHGEFDPEAFHEATFRAFLESLGASATWEDMEALTLWPETRAFNSILASACLLDEVEVGVATLGVIELAFAEISATIGRAVVARGWVDASALRHYKLHEAIDERHAAELFAVIEPAWQEPDRRYFIQQGLELGAFAFDQLYRGFDLASRRSAQG